MYVVPPTLAQITNRRQCAIEVSALVFAVSVAVLYVHIFGNGARYPIPALLTEWLSCTGLFLSGWELLKLAYRKNYYSELASAASNMRVDALLQASYYGRIYRANVGQQGRKYTHGELRLAKHWFRAEKPRNRASSRTL